MDTWPTKKKAKKYYGINIKKKSNIKKYEKLDINHGDVTRHTHPVLDDHNSNSYRKIK
jgi:hypothetical protein